jgi:hypothetical protein
VRTVANAAGGPFAERGPVTVADLERGRPVDAPRGGLVLLRPRGVVFGQQPVFAWTSVPGVTSYAVTVRDAAGRVVWRADAETRLTIPSDPASIGGAPGTASSRWRQRGARRTVAAAGSCSRRSTPRGARAGAAAARFRRRRAGAGSLAAQAGWGEQALALAEDAPGRREPGTPAHAISQFVRRSLGLPLEGEVPHGEK